MSKQDEIIALPLYADAEKLLKEEADNYEASLLLQSKLIAFQRKDDLVLSNHVKEAKDVIRAEWKQKWTRELMLVVGGALLGAFVQGFITELSNGNSALVVIYVLLGFIGMFLVFWSLRQR